VTLHDVTTAITISNTDLHLVYMFCINTIYTSTSEHDYDLYVANGLGENQAMLKLLGPGDHQLPKWRDRNRTHVSFHLRGRTAPIEVVDEEEDDRADLSFSSLSSLNAF